MPPAYTVLHMWHFVHRRISTLHMWYLPHRHISTLNVWYYRIIYRQHVILQYINIHLVILQYINIHLVSYSNGK